MYCSLRSKRFTLQIQAIALTNIIMTISPKTLLKIIDSEDAEVFIAIQRNRNLTLLQKHLMRISTTDAESIKSFIEEETGLTIDLQTILFLFEVHPRAKADYLSFSLLDTETKDQILSMVSEFFIGCEWPKIRDDVDGEKFLELLMQEIASFKKTTIDFYRSSGAPSI